MLDRGAFVTSHLQLLQSLYGIIMFISGIGWEKGDIPSSFKDFGLTG